MLAKLFLCVGFLMPVLASANEIEKENINFSCVIEEDNFASNEDEGKEGLTIASVDEDESKDLKAIIESNYEERTLFSSLDDEDEGKSSIACVEEEQGSSLFNEEDETPKSIV